MPLAFIFEDFTLFCKGVPLTREEVAAETIIPDAVTIRFRFDKSPTNFSERHYKRTGHCIFDPVDAAHSILRRAIKLQVQPHEPLSYFVQDTGQYKGKKVLLLTTDIIDIMRDMCKQSYPESHYMHKNYKRIDCHSNRVTAAVALANAGRSVLRKLLIGFDGNLSLLNTIYVNALKLLDLFVLQPLKEPCSFNLYMYIFYIYKHSFSLFFGDLLFLPYITSPPLLFFPWRIYSSRRFCTQLGSLLLVCSSPRRDPHLQ